MSEELSIVLRVTKDRRLAEEWELVLLAQHLSPSLRPSADGVALCVPEAELARALASLSAYERENPRKPVERIEAMESPSWFAGAAVASLLLVFHFVTYQWLPVLPWLERGSADAQRILEGEFWRTVTALTLHADIGHALSNAFAVGIFFSALSSMVGAGLGGLLMLSAGAGGNLANAFLHGSPHDSVGVSTAIFGAVGLLGSLGMIRRRQRTFSRWRAWLPVAAALALLGMLGSGGQRVDIWAHLSGLLTGALLGVIVARVAPAIPGPRSQWACGTAALVTVIFCWTLAWR
jgi:rhomboid protease GluP